MKCLKQLSLRKYNLSVSGSSDKGYYAISGNILDQEGIINNSGYKRYTFRANVARKKYMSGLKSELI